MRILLIASLLILAAPLHTSVGAQRLSASLTVVVFDSANAIPLEGSRIAIRGPTADTGNTALNTSRFAGTDGHATFVRLDSGAYEIHVRRLGYAPRDTIVRLHAPYLARQISVGMRQLHYTLANVSVHATEGCVDPGLAAHDPQSDVGVVLDAVAENAQREKTLRARYPFTYLLERTSWYSQSPRNVRYDVKTDTLQFRGNVFSPYRVGGVIVPDSDASGDTQNQRRIFRIPTLVDLADTTFLQTHCFRVEGTRGKGADAVAVVSFRPLDSIMQPDASGEILLDAKTLLLRRAAFSLTHSDSLGGDVISFSVSTSYRVLAPGLAIMDEITSNQLLPRSMLRFEEQQKLRGLHFIGASVPGYVVRPEDETGALAGGTIYIQRPVRDTLATLTGTISDEHGHPLNRAVIWIGASIDSAQSHWAETDSAGRFRLASLAPGPLPIGVRRIGSRPSQFSLTLPRGDSLVVAIRVSTLVLSLPEVNIEAAPPSPLKTIGFMDRKFRYGRATFRDPEDLQRRPPTQLVDLLAGTMGVTIGRVNAYGGGTIPMGRGVGGTSCPMALYVDGQFVNTMRQGPGGRVVAEPIEDVVNISDVRAAEIYPDGPNVPGEFQAPGLKSACGALVLWTVQTIE